MRSHPTAALALALLVLPGTGAPESLLPDAGWKDGVPPGWVLRVGATSGTERESEVLPGPEGGLALRGDPSTGRWRLAARPFEVKAGAAYRLSFEARARGLRLDPRQFDNAYVGVSLPAGGGAPDRRLLTVPERPWTADEIVFRAPADGTAEAWVFLSKSGTLEVRRLLLEALAPGDSFEVLVRNMGRYYSHFGSGGADWPGLVAAHRAKCEAAGDPEAFAAAARDLLAGLRDMHVWIRKPDGATVPTWQRDVRRNFDYEAVRRGLQEPRILGRLGLAGTVGDDLGYLAVFSLPSREEEFAPLLAAFDGMLDRKGILLDLRANSGGSELRAMALAGAFAREPVVYARSSFRSGPGPGDLTPPVDRVLRPRQGRRFEGRVVCLVGPGCVSSGEGFAQMMAAIPGVVLAGLPTGGASGNPAPVDLPNGVSVWFSRWVDYLPDGTPLEGRGVPPDRVVKHEGPGDPTFDAGVRILRE